MLRLGSVPNKSLITDFFFLDSQPTLFTMEEVFADWLLLLPLPHEKEGLPRPRYPVLPSAGALTGQQPELLLSLAVRIVAERH